MTQKKAKFFASPTAVNFYSALLFTAAHVDTFEANTDHEDCLAVRPFSFPFWNCKTKKCNKTFTVCEKS